MTNDGYTAVADYAVRFHRAVGTKHHVASPLGAWLLIAMSGAGDSALAEALLDTPHPLVAAASAMWHAPHAEPPSLPALPASTATGPLPDQAGLDRWARENTFGLIEQFPLKLSPEVVLVLASALATRISWEHPFELAPASALGPDSPWAGRLSTVLRSPSPGHRALVAESERAGRVIVHEAGADGLRVISVAAGPGVAPDRVIAAAHEVAAGARQVSLSDLPLGDSPLYRVWDEPEAAKPGEFAHAVLPAWSARNQHDLGAAEFGFAAVAERLGRDRFEAAQSAVARYDRYGFEAAAVTGFMSLTSFTPPGPARFAELRFGHPYAVVAVATQPGGPWDGMPVFSAWVSDPDDADPEEF
jgi:hypothetical protein